MEEKRSYEAIAADVLLAQNGDAEAMDRIIADVRDGVYYTCLRILKNEANAEDVTQDVLFAIYRKLGTLKEPGTYVGWVHRMTANRCKDLLMKSDHEIFLASDAIDDDPFVVFEDVDEQSVPDKAIDNAETQRMILELVDTLPDEQRVCVTLFYYNEMKTREIADALGIPEGTVKSRLNYARKAIREGVGKYEKQGIRLYGLSPIPFLRYFLGGALDESNAKAAAGIAAHVSKTAAAGAAAAGSASGGALASIAGRIAAGLVSIGILGGIGFGVFRLLDSRRIDPGPVIAETEKPVETAVAEGDETPAAAKKTDTPEPTAAPETDTPAPDPTPRATARPQATRTPSVTPDSTPATPSAPARTPTATPEWIPDATPTAIPVRVWSDWSENEPPADAEEVETQEQIRWRFIGTQTVETAAGTWQEDCKASFDAFRTRHRFSGYTVAEPGTPAGNGLVAYTATFYTNYTDWEKKEGAEPPDPFDAEQTLVSETRIAYRYR